MIDVDNLLKQIYHSIPQADSEMLYAFEINRIMKVYIVMAVIGLLIVTLILINMVG